MFIRRNKDLVFRALGLNYGEVYFEGANPTKVYDFETACMAILEAEDALKLDKAEVEAVVEQIREARLANTLEDFFAAVSSVEQSDGPLLYEFIVCTCDCKSTTHGHVAKIDTGGKRIHTSMMFNLVAGFQYLRGAAEIPAYESVRLLKLMIAAGIPCREDLGFEGCERPTHPDDERRRC